MDSTSIAILLATLLCLIFAAYFIYVKETEIKQRNKEQEEQDQ